MGVRLEEFCAHGEEFRMQQFQHAGHVNFRVFASGVVTLDEKCA
jgi:hypothetical protein